MEKSINKQFLILQTIGILLVVLGHKGGISLFSDWFEPYSFHMPLFIFISGYFYKKQNDFNFKGFLIKKIKSLLIPYFVWNFIYGIIVFILKRRNIINFGDDFTFNSLFIEPWKGGHQFIFNLASWFVLALFIVHISYALFRIILKTMKIENDYILLLIIFSIGCTGIFLANDGYLNGWYLPLIRTMFLLPFYHIGYLYKEKIEKKDSLNNYIYFLLIFTIQFLLIKKYKALGFSSVWCNDFNKTNILLPYITSLTGILFWLRISKILVPSVNDSKIIKYVGENTWTIMMHHIFIFFLFNLFLSYVSPILGLSGFDYNALKNDIYYAYTPDTYSFRIFYVILGITIPLTTKYTFSRITSKLNYLNLNFIKYSKKSSSQ